MKGKVKNIILFSTVLIAQVPSIFFGTAKRLNLSIFIERSTRLDFFTMYYANTISFLIMAYLLHYPKWVNKKITRFILIICYLDLMHLVFLAKQGFGMVKIGVAITLFIGYELFNKNKNG